MATRGSRAHVMPDERLATLAIARAAAAQNVGSRSHPLKLSQPYSSPGAQSANEGAPAAPGPYVPRNSGHSLDPGEMRLTESEQVSG